MYFWRLEVMDYSMFSIDYEHDYEHEHEKCIFREKIIAGFEDSREIKTGTHNT